MTEFSLPCCAEKAEEAWLVSMTISPKSGVYSQNFGTVSQMKFTDDY